MESPEATGDYHCPTCGNTRAFIGYDDHGYPGPDECECGQDPCQCEVTLRQPFTVREGGDIHYQAFDGGGHGAEIASYTRIQCAVCQTFTWSDHADGRTVPNP